MSASWVVSYRARRWRLTGGELVRYSTAQDRIEVVEQDILAWTVDQRLTLRALQEMHQRQPQPAGSPEAWEVEVIYSFTRCEDEPALLEWWREHGDQ